MLATTEKNAKSRVFFFSDKVIPSQSAILILFINS
jgi:hypothetical protein